MKKNPIVGCAVKLGYLKKYFYTLPDKTKYHHYATRVSSFVNALVEMVNEILKTEHPSEEPLAKKFKEPLAKEFEINKPDIIINSRDKIVKIILEENIINEKTWSKFEGSEDIEEKVKRVKKNLRAEVINVFKFKIGENDFLIILSHRNEKKLITPLVFILNETANLLLDKKEKLVEAVKSEEINKELNEDMKSIIKEGVGYYGEKLSVLGG